MSERSASGRFPVSVSSESLTEYQRRFEGDGYLVFEGVVERATLAALARDIVAQWRADTTSGALFVGGGNVSGHLNCFPGERSRFVYDALEGHGIFDIVAALSPQPLRPPNIGCNLNLPGSSPQNEHVDGYAAAPFLVVNVAGIDTTLANGAMEVLPGTHRRELKYWEIALRPWERRRVTLKQGDVVLRTSALWHRGMPNRSADPRPMLAFTWEGGGSKEQDPYALHQGRITFLPNRYKTDWKGRLVERAFVAAPRLGTAYRAARSLLE